tara:strand:- start:548 stop:1054 length:507 start_codon:yes stop_codon:yes gene_type:complete
MADYTTQHRNRLSDPLKISKSKVEMGQVAKIRYKKVNGDSDNYFVFVLNPKFKTYFHCLDLKHIHPSSFFRLAKGFDEVISNTASTKKLDLTKLNLNVNAKNFYLTEIRNNKTLKLAGGYRTLVYKNISSIIVYNYDYGIFDQVGTKADRRLDDKVDGDDMPDFLQGI